MDVLVRGRSVVVGYDGSPVAAPASFDVRPGDALALVGPNGAGKTTLLRAVLGLVHPLAGDLDVLGRRVDERRAAFRRAVARVVDDDAFFPFATVREHLGLVARGHGVRRPDEAVDGELAAWGLGAVADVLPSGLSSGQRRRLVLAAAFVRPRRLLVMDEPEQRLDVVGRDLLAQRLAQELTDGGALVLATHDAVLLDRVAGAVLLLADDRTDVVDVDSALAALVGRPGR